jgi:hypothetical protein
MRNIALIYSVIHISILIMSLPTLGDESVETIEIDSLEMTISLVFQIMVILGIANLFFLYGWYREVKRIDYKNRICSNCDTVVNTSAVVRTNSCKVLGVADSTRSIKSSNPVVGLTNTGGHMGVGIGAVQSTSHIPVKLGKVEFTVSCPFCEAVFSWVENREVIQWTDQEGQVSYDIPGVFELP